MPLPPGGGGIGGGGGISILAMMLECTKYEKCENGWDVCLPSSMRRPEAPRGMPTCMSNERLLHKMLHAHVKNIIKTVLYATSVERSIYKNRHRLGKKKK